MSLQLPLFDRESKLNRRFADFHRLNPDVYATLVRLARHAVARGHKRLSVKMLFEVARWEMTVNVARRDGDYELNNSFTSRYARLIAQQEADLANVFETRELRS